MLWISPQVPSSLFGGHIMLVIAHPDDEAMFFSPLLFELRGRCKVTIVCLSTGDADGLGTIRRHELITSAQYFGLDAQDIVQIDDPLLPDGIHTKWSHNVIAQHVTSLVTSRRPNLVVTFDAGGVSQHANHIATYHGVRQALLSFPKLDGLQLHTTSVLRKFIGALDVPYSILTSDIAVFRFNLMAAYYAMSLHKSQFVWYRRFFILLSRYSFVNTFSLIPRDW